MDDAITAPATPTIVTGGGRGIGAAIAHMAARHGCPVGVLDVDADNAALVAGEIVAAGGRALALVSSTMNGVQAGCRGGRLDEAAIALLTQQMAIE